MSELKAYRPYANRDGFYLKSEADKVIAEKDKVITYARALVREDMFLRPQGLHREPRFLQGGEVMKRKERMEWYIERICKLLKRLPVTQANEIELKALWVNIGGQIMAIELHHLNTHGMMEEAGNVLDGVARLKERIAELEEERRWRKFPDEKPEEWETVVVRISGGFYDLAVYLSNGQGWDIGDGLYHKPEEVSHWMPFPSAPREGE